MGRRKCVVVHFHAIMFQTDCFSDWLKIHNCRHHSIAYKMTYIFFRPSQAQCAFLLLCVSTVFFFSWFSYTEKKCCFITSCITDMLFLRVITYGFSKISCLASYNPAWKYYMLPTDRHFNVRCSRKWMFLDSTPDGWWFAKYLLVSLLRSTLYFGQCLEIAFRPSRSPSPPIYVAEKVTIQSKLLCYWATVKSANSVTTAQMNGNTLFTAL